MSDRKGDFVHWLCAMIVAWCALLHSRSVRSELKELKAKIEAKPEVKPVEGNSAGE